MLTVGHKICLKEIKYYYEILNKYVFDEQLTRPKLQIRRMNNSWGRCDGYVVYGSDNTILAYNTHIILNPKQLCPQLCMVNLAHEMVHQYQWQIESIDRVKQGKEALMSHGPSFFKWRQKFKYFGLPLATGHYAEKIAIHQDIWAN
jgi:hypothetical protein